jgi:hypothetical protein
MTLGWSIHVAPRFPDTGQVVLKKGLGCATFMLRRLALSGRLLGGGKTSIAVWCKQH